jgi:glucose/arabinose dehydrogenase
MGERTFVIILLIAQSTSSCNPCSSILSGASFASGLCGEVIYTSTVGLRKLSLSPSTHTTLALAKNSKVIELNDANNDGSYDSATTIVSAVNGLNHGLAVHDGQVYASSSSTVYRWNFNDLHDGSGDKNKQEIVVKNINSGSGHKTRSLSFNHNNISYNSSWLYVSVGSGSNVDSSSFRSNIRRFNMNKIPKEGYDFTTEGELFADGLRNEVGLTFDDYDTLWGVENGADKLYREDLGGDIHSDNPAEELNRFPEYLQGETWGYPYCFTEYSLDDSYGLGKGTVWAWPDFLNDGIHNDTWCRKNTQPPELAMQGHSAPLGISFFKYKSPTELPAECASTSSSSGDSGGGGGGSLGEEFDGDAFIAFHGSWNREVPTGYKVVRIKFNATTRLPMKEMEPIDIMWHGASGGSSDDDDVSATWPSGFRPVDVIFDACNRMLVSSDGRGASGIVMIYNNTVGTLISIYLYIHVDPCILSFSAVCVCVHVCLNDPTYMNEHERNYKNNSYFLLLFL